MDLWSETYFDLLLKFQERALALSESRPSPALYSSADVRPLKMEDFRYAHEQVFVLAIYYHCIFFGLPNVHVEVITS